MQERTKRFHAGCGQSCFNVVLPKNLLKTFGDKVRFEAGQAPSFVTLKAENLLVMKNSMVAGNSQSGDQLVDTHAVETLQLIKNTGSPSWCIIRGNGFLECQRIIEKIRVDGQGGQNSSKGPIEETYVTVIELEEVREDGSEVDIRAGRRDGGRIRISNSLAYFNGNMSTFVMGSILVFLDTVSSFTRFGNSLVHLGEKTCTFSQGMPVGRSRDA